MINRCLIPLLAILCAATPADQTAKAFKSADGFEVKLAAAEPMVRQPVGMTFDARGRLWVVQYLQYPHPAGLKPVTVDQFLRTKYDRIPEPPPRGPKGEDRITILEDTDGDGRFDKSKDFVTGLNIASSVEIGHGGVWVAQAPYLLFYPDRDADDVPDGDPEVHLTGFGLEDTHSVVNHLTWGPDGWLYGAQGSTCTASVRGHTFQQAAWRYHPRTKEFEVFSEGGGNTFGLEWDPHGNLLTGTNHNNHVAFHYVQGGYFLKVFGKHGPLTNPYSFGYFDHVPHTGWRGGHVTQLGVVYQGGAFPTEYDGKWIAPNVLQHFIDVHALMPAGSTFTSRRERELLRSDDRSFRPVDMLTGPDGAIYLADWSDPLISHLELARKTDKETGRIWRLAPPGLPAAELMDLAKSSSGHLAGLLNHPNDWYARIARRLLAERRDASVVPTLKALVLGNEGRLALQALWALYVSGGFDDATAREFLKHANPDVRSWTVRLLGDAKKVSAESHGDLVRLAASDQSPVVRAQLACSARRLPAAQGLPLAHALMRRAEDADDPYVPLLLWWAIESKAASDRDAVLALWLDSDDTWAAPLARKHLTSRIARRFAAEPNDENLAACARLIDRAPASDKAVVLAGLDKGLEGIILETVPPSLKVALDRMWPGGLPAQEAAAVRVALRTRDPRGVAAALKLVEDPKAAKPERTSLIAALAQVAPEGASQVMLKLAGGKDPVEVRAAAIKALQRCGDAAAAQRLVESLPAIDHPDLRAATLEVLTGRPDFAAALLAAIDRGTLAPAAVPLDTARRILLLQDPALDRLVTKHFGQVKRTTPEEKQQAVAAVKQVLSAGAGDVSRGKVVFTAACAQCHSIFNAGGKQAPDLTNYERKNPDALLPHIIDPSAAVREEYATWVLKTKTRSVLTGPIVESTPLTVTIEDGQQRITVPRAQIDKLEPSAVSRMPEGILEAMTAEQIRDLFAFLASDGGQ